MKKFLYIFIVTNGILSLAAWSQQLPHYTQFMFNDYVLNPAVAGTKDHYQIRANSSSSLLQPLPEYPRCINWHPVG